MDINWVLRIKSRIKCSLMETQYHLNNILFQKIPNFLTNIFQNVPKSFDKSKSKTVTTRHIIHPTIPYGLQDNIL